MRMGIAAPKLHIGIFLDGDQRYIGDRFNYISKLGMERDFQRPRDDEYTLALSETMRVPPAWEEIQRYFTISVLRGDLDNHGLAQLGNITMQLGANGGRVTAYTVRYYPKKMLPYQEGAHGLGYATEAMVITSLAGRITHVSSTDISSMARTAQLEKVGLPVGQAVPVERWMRAMKRGFFMGMRRSDVALATV